MAPSHNYSEITRERHDVILRTRWLARHISLLIVLALPLAACTSFSAVRSAKVRPGLGAEAVVALSGRVNDETGWLYSFECAEDCEHEIPGIDAAVSYGWPRTIAGLPGTVSLGMNGIYPYADAYLQIGGGSVPFGVGGRVGLPLTGWAEHQVYGRLDVPLGDRARLLLNPAFFALTGHSRSSRGSLVAFVQGVGLEIDAGRVSFTPAVSLVAGRVERVRSGSGAERGPAVFPTASLGISLHRKARR